MRYLYAIDPGACTGWAIFCSGFLVSCGTTSVDKHHVMPVYADDSELIIELPQIYSARLMKGDPNNLITLAVEVGRWIERASAANMKWSQVKPAVWKGQITKPIHHKRAAKLLTEGELKHCPKLPATAKDENCWDAIALGLWKLGRLKK